MLATATDRHTAEREVARLAGQLWADRHRFNHTLTSISDALVAVTAPDETRWILSESGDNPGGGGRGTCTDLLRALIDGHATDVLFGLFVDSDLAGEACAKGVGARFDAQFLRRTHDAFSQPFSAKAEVLACSDGQVVGRRGLVAGRRVDLGSTTALKIGGVTVVVVSTRKQCADPVYFEHLGLNPADFRTVVVKSRGPFPRRV